MRTFYITVPIDSTAVISLDLNQATNEQLIELHLNEKEFKKVWDSGLFKSINSLAGSFIEISEDDKVDDMIILDKVINSGIFNNANYNVEIQPIISKIKDLFIEARNRRTGIFFYF